MKGAPYLPNSETRKLNKFIADVYATAELTDSEADVQTALRSVGWSMNPLSAVEVDWGVSRVMICSGALVAYLICDQAKGHKYSVVNAWVGVKDQ
jgi:hypothetical protein